MVNEKDSESLEVIPMRHGITQNGSLLSRLPTDDLRFLLSFLQIRAPTQVHALVHIQALNTALRSYLYCADRAVIDC